MTTKAKNKVKKSVFRPSAYFERGLKSIIVKRKSTVLCKCRGNYFLSCDSKKEEEELA